jgi:hypothetical protein
MPSDHGGNDRQDTKGHAMFLFYFNKLGWAGSIVLSIVVTLALVATFRLLAG